MGILSRFKDIMSSNINALLDKCEDPAKMVDQYLANAISDLAKVKEETAAVMAEEKRVGRELDELKKGIEKYQNLAIAAVEKGNDEDAEQFIAQKQRLEAQLVNVQKSYDVARSNSDKMRQMHDKLTDDINEMKARRNNVKAQIAVAKTQEKVNKFKDNAHKVSGAMGSFSRMEERAQERLDRAMATGELNDSIDAESDKLKAAEARYSGASSTSVKDELAALKVKLGKNTAEESGD